jgi:glycerophosphoryl diester phosphodiesterase
VKSQNNSGRVKMKIIFSRSKFLFALLLATMVATLTATVAMAADEPENAQSQPRSTSEDFLRLNVRPIAIGHHGVGPNTGDNPALPIENTVESVRQAYSLGARVVEVDVQLTRDNRLAVFHDDFLSDFTCVHSLTLDQLQERLPFVPELHQILEVRANSTTKRKMTWAAFSLSS